MIVDNFELIKSLLSFKSEGDFYTLQIIKRRKDNPYLSITSEIIQNYYISSLDEFNKLEEEIKIMCSTYNARAYINLSVKSRERVAFRMIKKIAEYIYEKQYESVEKAYLSESEKSKSEHPIWVIDVDSNDESLLNKLITEIESCQSEYSIITIGTVPTPNGYHVLTRPFNVKELEPFLAITDNVEVKKESPTLLYYSN